MEQDGLKILLKSVIFKTENDQLTSIDDIIQFMMKEFPKIAVGAK